MSHISDLFKGFGSFSVSRQYSKDFVVSPVSRHFSYSRHLGVSCLLFPDTLED